MTENNKSENIVKRYSTGVPRSVSGGRKISSSSDLEIIKMWSKALPDPFKSDYRTLTEGYEIISPPINPNTLSKVVQENSFLHQCIRAMVTNTIGFGYTFEFSGNYGEEITESSPEALAELRQLEELFDQPNPFQTYSELLERLFEDKNTYENAYLEVIRDEKGRVISFTHIPASTVRITKVEATPVPIVVELKRYGKSYKQKIQKHFRKFVQIKPDGFTKIFFKEFGDPRKIDPKTGKENLELSLEDAATEIIHLSDYNPNSVYGIPRWYSQLPSIIGSRQAELTNLDFFENNAIPAMAILVAGGLLTEETVDLLENNFDTVKGRSSMNKIAIIEASPNLDSASSTGAVPTPSIKMEPLYAARQQDANFLNYTEDCMLKIMSCFRLPPVYIAGGKDYTYASSKTSIEVAETQVFMPARKLWDDVINKTIMASWGIKYWTYKTNNATIATTEDLINAIEAFTKAGCITPNIAIQLMNKALNIDVPEVEKVYGDIPTQYLESLLRGAGGEDKTNLFINGIKILTTDTVEQLEPIKVQTPGNADAITDPVNDPKDAPKSTGSKNAG
jgi:PBSX family phage portal protein